MPMFNKPPFNSHGVADFLRVTKPNKNSTGSHKYPKGPWKNVNTRCEEKDLHVWFTKMVDEAATGFDSPDAAIGNCELMPGLAIFAKFSWEQNILSSCSIQALIAPGNTLTEYYLDSNSSEAHYNRLDYSIEERGSIFNHPFPHIHSQPDGPPRFPFPISSESFPPLDFIEFIFLNYYHEEWQKWIETIHDSQTSSFLKNNNIELEDAIDAFKKAPLWERFKKPEDLISEIKRAAQQEKAKLTANFPTIPDEHFLLNYW
jgi:hypothetical protein